MTGKRIDPHRETIRRFKKMSKPHDAKTIGTSVAPAARTLHFKHGKRVCLNCELVKPLGASLLGCPKYGWEFSTKLAREQRLCRD